MNKKILIVDDDEFLLDMYVLKFKESGFDVIACRGGEETLKKIREGLKPDVMLLDIVMPAIDGFEVLTDQLFQSLIFSSQISIY